MDNYFINQGIRHVYVSSSLKHLKDRFIKNYRLEEISSKNKKDCKNLVFFGLYTDKDRIVYKMFRNINKYVIFGGNDLFGSKRKLNIKLIKDTRPAMVYSISEDIKNKLDELNIINTNLNINLTSDKIFNIKIDKSNSNKIYIYNGLANNLNKDSREEIYGKEYYEEVMKRLPQYEYILSNEKYYPYEEMPRVYSECFIGLRLTKNDGNANMVQEMKQMNIPVVHNSSDYGLKWETVDDIIKHIKNNDRNNNEIIIDSNKKYLVICIDMKLNRIAGDTIWCSNLINRYLKKYDKIALITSSEDNDNFIKNIDDINKLRIIVIKNNRNIIEYINNNNNKIDKIIIRNNDLLKYINNEIWLDKTVLYGLDTNLEIIKQITNYKNIWTQSEKLKKLYIDNGIKESLIKIKEPYVYKYNFDIPERDDKEIRLIYCGTLRDEENILEIIEEFKKIHKERPEVVLKMVYGKIIGDNEFKNRINQIIKEGVDGITFKYNLSHRAANYEIAMSDIGICWRKSGWGDNGEISTKVKEYELYGLALLSDNIKISYEEIYILYLMKTISDKNTTMFLNNEYDIIRKIELKMNTLLVEREFNKWKQNVYSLIQNFKIPDKKLILYCKSVTKSTSVGGYVERGHQILKSINHYSDKYYCICIDSFFGIRKKQNIKCVTMIDNVIYISISNILYSLLKNKFSYYAIESYNYIIRLLNIRCLHSPSFFKHSIISIICSKKNNIPHFYEVRGRFDITLFESWSDLKKKKYSQCEKIVENTSQGIFYITNECKDFVEKYDNINVENEILPNSIDIIDKECNINNILTSEVLFDNSIKFVIGYFGSTFDYENFDLIIPTIDILIKKYKDIGFIFGGNAVDKCIIRLNNLQKKYPNNVILKNYLPKEELLLIYKQLNLFVIPRKDIVVSHIITPLKPFELLLNKVPLLMSNVSCLKNISDNGKRCRIFDIKKNDAFLKAIEDIYKNGYPNELLENGYNFAINNGWDKTVKIREKLYNKFID